MPPHNRIQIFNYISLHQLFVKTEETAKWWIGH